MNKPSSKRSYRLCSQLDKRPRQTDAEQFAETTATALTLVESSRAARHGAYWRRWHTADSLSVFGYYAKKPGRKKRHGLIAPALLLATYRDRLVLLLEMPATAKMRIAIYRPGAWESALRKLIPTPDKLLGELIALDNPAINDLIASWMARHVNARQPVREDRSADDGREGRQS